MISHEARTLLRLQMRCARYRLLCRWDGAARTLLGGMALTWGLAQKQDGRIQLICSMMLPLAFLSLSAAYLGNEEPIVVEAVCCGHPTDEVQNIVAKVGLAEHSPD